MFEGGFVWWRWLQRLRCIGSFFSVGAMEQVVKSVGKEQFQASRESRKEIKVRKSRFGD
jgi:hypothetical protein